MEKIIKEISSVSSSVKMMRRVTVTTLVVSFIFGLVCLAFSLYLVKEQASSIYVLDKGSVATATQNPSDVQREFEVHDHVARFHELLMNLSPSTEAIKSNVDRALTMSDKSAYNYWQDLSEQGFYNRLVSANITQQFSLEELSVDMNKYPYEAFLTGKLYLLRESNITAYQIKTTCQLIDVGRSKGNPHGLMIEKFQVVSNEKIGTRKRN